MRPLAVSDPSLKALSAGIDEQIIEVLTGRGMAPLPASGVAKAAVLIDGSTQSVADKVQVVLRFSTGKDHVSLWSTSFERPAADTIGFADQVSAKVSDIMECVAASASPRLGLKVSTRSLYLKMCDLHRQTDRADEVFDLARQIEEQAPNFTAPVGDVAVAGARSPRATAAGAGRQGARAEATAAADRVLKADPKEFPRLSRQVPAGPAAQQLAVARALAGPGPTQAASERHPRRLQGQYIGSRWGAWARSCRSFDAVWLWTPSRRPRPTP